MSKTPNLIAAKLIYSMSNPEIAKTIKYFPFLLYTVPNVSSEMSVINGDIRLFIMYNDTILMITIII